MTNMKRIYRSEASQQQEGNSANHRPTCHSCGLDMAEAILNIRYPKGTLPVRGFICPKCGYEVISFEDAKNASETAERLGLIELEGAITREITKSGDQLAVYIPKDIEREFDLRQRTKVRIYAKRNEIILAPV